MIGAKTLLLATSDNAIIRDDHHFNVSNNLKSIHVPYLYASPNASSQRLKPTTYLAITSNRSPTVRFPPRNLSQSGHHAVLQQHMSKHHLSSHSRSFHNIRKRQILLHVHSRKQSSIVGGRQYNRLLRGREVQEGPCLVRIKTTNSSARSMIFQQQQES